MKRVAAFAAGAAALAAWVLALKHAARRQAAPVARRAAGRRNRAAQQAANPLKQLCVKRALRQGRTPTRLAQNPYRKFYE